jgi:hypothetical protein
VACFKVLLHILLRDEKSRKTLTRTGVLRYEQSTSRIEGGQNVPTKFNALFHLNDEA